MHLRTKFHILQSCRTAEWAPAHSFDYGPTPEALESKMADTEVIAQLEGIVGPLLEREGAELVELALGGGRRRRALRVYVDRPGGITIDECARLNRLIGELLEAEDPIEGSYVLEVSSPGLDRALKTDRDFGRSVGQKVRVILSTGAVHVGLLRGVPGDTVLLEMGGKTVSFDRHTIARANLDVDF